MPKRHRWFEDHDNIVVLARWMADNGYDAYNVAYMVEKPWKHEPEYTEALKSLEDAPGPALTIVRAEEDS